ncbi:MAG: DUF3592 domain-containing protein [Gammaproteobacteria bacterium]|nr:DUF3592 domain-containing protein [Gammaproteobacteria bacterium]
MKGRIFLLVFSLPFLGVGLWMLWSVGSNLHDAWRMQDWVPADARLQRAGYETHEGDDSDTYLAFALYDYSFAGQHYSGDRVGIAAGADNVGDYQRDTGRRLQQAWSQGVAITVHVNPSRPAESVIDRNLRWGLVGFKSIFLLVFGGAGAGMLAYSLLASRPRDSDAPGYEEKPWLLNDAWQSESVFSNSKKSVYVAWGFAVFWNAISAPLPFVAYREIVEKQNFVVLIGLLFPTIGLVLIGWAIRQTQEWGRLGPAPVVLDPFPGSIGGHVGGTVDLRLPFDPNRNFSLTLTNLRSYLSGSGKNRSRREKALWQDARTAHAEPSARGTRLSFRFEPPTGLNPSDAQRDSNDYFVWRLNMHADMPGADIDRDYDIPVYATGAQSRRLPARVVDAARLRQEQLDDAAVERRLRSTDSYAGKEVYFPMGRNSAGALAALLFGGVFAAAGWFLATSEGQSVFGGVFVAVGAMVMLAGLYGMLNSLRVTAGPIEITSERRVLAIPVRRRRIRRDEFAGFRYSSSKRTQSGSRHVVHYTIFADDRHGNSIVLGENFAGSSQARAAIRWLAREFGLEQRLSRGGEDETGTGSDAADETDVLAADR